MIRTPAAFLLTSLLAVLLHANAAHAVAAVTIIGQVLDPRGEPAADARVLVQHYVRTSHNPIVTDRPVCDEAGRFSLDLKIGFPEHPIEVVALKPGHAMAWVSVTGERDHDVTLRLGANPLSCTGTVADPEGRPLAGAQVSVWLLRRGEGEATHWMAFSPFDDDFPPATTDAQGHFHLRGFPPDVNVSLAAVAEGRERGTTEDPVPAGATRIKFVLDLGASISGRVTLNGEPVSGVRVYCDGQDPGHAGGIALSQADGTYRLDHLTPDTYTVALFRAEDLLAAPLTGISVKPGEEYTGADLAVTPGALISGKVTEATTGKPVREVNIEAWAMNYPYFTYGAAPQIITDENGGYTIRVIPGKTRVRCLHSSNPHLPSDMAEPRERVVEVAEGDRLTGVDFALGPCPNIHGQVLTPDGGPAAGVEVTVPTGYGAGGRLPVFIATKTDAEGEFDLRLDKDKVPFLRPPWLVVARDAERGLAQAALVEEWQRPVELQLAPGGYLLTQAVDARGEPVPEVGAVVYAEREHGLFCMAWAQSDEQGTLRLGPLPSNFPLLVTSHDKIRSALLDDEWWSLKRHTLMPGEERELPPIRVNLKGRTVRGWVIDKAQQAVAGALVFGTGASEPATTDEEGHFELTGSSARGMVLLIAIHPTKLLVAGQELNPDWEFEPGLMLEPTASATGRVVDQQDQPVRSEVHVQLSHHRSYPEFEMPSLLIKRLQARSFGWKATTDDQGRWVVNNLIGGLHYRAGVSLQDGTGQAEFPAKPGETVTVDDIVLKPRQ